MTSKTCHSTSLKTTHVSFVRCDLASLRMLKFENILGHSCEISCLFAARTLRDIVSVFIDVLECSASQYARRKKQNCDGGA